MSTAILTGLRLRGIRVRKTLSGQIQVSSDPPMTEAVRQEIREKKAEILAALEAEAAAAVEEAEVMAQKILEKGKVRRGVATVERDGLVFVSCRRRDGASWTIQIPSEAWDPWKLAAVIMSAGPEPEGRGK